MIEYKLNLESQKYIFIEINARFWGSLPLAISCGVDFPYFLYLMHKTGETNFPQDYKKNIFQHNFEADLSWKIDALINKRFLFVFQEEITQIIRIIAQREKVDEFCWQDRAVFWAVIHEFVSSRKRSYLLKKFKKKPQIIAKKLLEEIKKGNRILFVCYGNICRSCFSQLYINQKYNMNAKSAGYYRHSGRKINTEIAIMAADKYELNSDSFRSQRVNESLINDADYVFCYDLKNLAYLTVEYPKYKSKFFLLGAYDCIDGNDNIEIEDPYLLNDKEKEKTLERITNIIDKNICATV